MTRNDVEEFAEFVRATGTQLHRGAAARRRPPRRGGPDRVDELVRVSTRRGSRIRRWRTAGASVAVVASCVAVVAIVGTTLSDSGGTAGSEPGVATQPTPSASPSPELRHHVQPSAVAPVSVDAPGWQCSEPADEKFICSKGAASVVVNWRPANERKYYLDPGKADVVEGVHTYVSEAHPPFFATAAPIEGTTQAQVDEVGAALVWTD